MTNEAMVSIPITQVAPYTGPDQLVECQNSICLNKSPPLKNCLSYKVLCDKFNSLTPSADTAKKSGGDDKTSVMSLMRRAPVPLLLVTKVMTAVPFMTLAQSLGVIGMTEFKLTPQMNGLLLSYNGVIGVVSYFSILV